MGADDGDGTERAPAAPAGPVHGRRGGLRTNLLLATSFAFYIVAITLISRQVDQLNFWGEKNEVMRDLYTRGVLFNIADSNVIKRHAEEYVRAVVRGDPAASETELKWLQGHLGEFVAANPCIAGLRVRGAKGTDLIAVDAPASPESRTLASRLILKGYRFRVSQPLTAFAAPDVLASVVLELVPPPGEPRIAALAWKWRLILFGVVALLTAAYAFLLRTLILPVRRVTAHLDLNRGGATPLIAQPRSLLERYYNNLARDATMARFATELRRHVGDDSAGDARRIYEALPALVPVLFGAEGAQVWWFQRRDANSPWTAERSTPPVATVAADPAVVAAALAQRLAQSADAASPQWAGARTSFPEAGAPAREACLVALQIAPTAAVLLVIHSHRKPTPWNAWRQDVYTRLGQEVRFAAAAIEAQERLILHEKSKANISLSRNLGHDLTNIIATSKLELLTVKKFLELSPEDIHKSPAREQIYREALQSLLDSTRFLQEIVNIYRSFTYLSRPKFEEIALASLVREVCELFSLSLSRSIRIEIDAVDGLAPIEVEPRLLRLALFNILSNAAEAIKRATKTGSPDGLISIRVAPGARPGAQEITVSDSGPGIRTEDGRLLDVAELHEVFRLGFTTKEKDGGEGLGLNWVQQIVRDFHGGEVTAENRPEGGARFRIVLGSGER